MKINQLSYSQACELIKTFKRPIKGDAFSTEHDYRGQFVSRPDFDDQPYVAGGYIHHQADPDLVEIWIGWEDVEGMEDSAFPPGGYKIDEYASTVHNWMTAAAAVKQHLEDIVREPDAGSKHNADPDYLRSLIERAGISQREAARRVGVSERIMRQYLADRTTKSALDAPYAVQYALEHIPRYIKQSANS